MSEIWDDADLPSRKATRINVDRMSTYGHPYSSHKLIASLWSAYLGIPLEVEDVSVLMILAKVAREKVGGFNLDYPDNVDDVCGFANTLYIVKEVRRARPDPADPTAGGEGSVGEAQLPRRSDARKPARRSRRAG